MKKEDLKVIVYGAPEWCHQCQEQLEIFQKEPLIINTKEIDIDSLEDDSILDKLDISSVPVLLLYNGEEELKRWEGTTESSEINTYIETLLD